MRDTFRSGLFTRVASWDRNPDASAAHRQVAHHTPPPDPIPFPTTSKRRRARPADTARPILYRKQEIEERLGAGARPGALHQATVHRVPVHVNSSTRSPPTSGVHSQDRSIGSRGQTQVHNSTQAINSSNTPRVIAPASTISRRHTTSDPPPRTPPPDCGPGGPVPPVPPVAPEPRSAHIADREPDAFVCRVP